MTRNPDDPKPRRPTRGPAAFLLRAAGCRAPEEILGELDEASAEVRWPALWRSWQLLLICGYRLRDRLRTLRAQPPIRPLLGLRFALRGVVRRPGVPLVAAITLALGFGAAAAIFSAYVGFTLPLPVPEGERVVQVRITEPDGESQAADPEVRREWSTAASLAALGTYRTGSNVISAAERDSVRVSGAVLDLEAFRLLRVAPSLGRLPDAGDSDVVLLSDRLWRGYLDGDRGAVGRQLRIDGRPRLVIGVMPPSFGFPFNQQLWELAPADETDPAPLVGRLASNVEPEVAAAELEGRLRELRGGDPEAVRVRVLGFTEARGEGGETVGLVALLVLVMALLLVSSTNVANLLLVRAGARARLLAIHVAIGARPAQVAFQLLAEALLIALGGAIVGLGCAWLVIDYIESTLSGHWGYHWMEVALRPSVLLFTLALAVSTAVACGLAPALRLARADLTVPLKGDAGGTTMTGRPSGWLVGVQVAFSSASLVVAALMVSGLLGSQRVHEGFPADEVRVASLQLAGERYAVPGARAEFRESLLARLATSPRLGPVALTSGVPGLNTAIGRLETDAGSPPEGTPPPRVAALAISADYPEVMGLRLLAGRTFGPGESTGDELVALVSESFVRSHLGGDPLGRRIRVSGSGLPDRWARVVGVIGDVVIYADRGEDYRDQVYLPAGQVDPTGLYVLYRSAGDPAEARAAVGAAARELDPDLPLGSAIGAEPGDPISAVLVYIRRLFVTIGVLGAVGGVAALLVAMIGLYGLLAFDVQSRVPEIGVRMALGADRSDVVRQIVRKGLRGLVPGLAIGAAAVWLAGPLFGIFLMGAEARDPRVFGITILLYLAVGGLAALAPARRAAGLDPAHSLRSD